MATEVETPFGHSLPPEGAHTITFHVPKWESAVKFREGDMSLVARLKSIYPRFMPFGPSAVVRPQRQLPPNLCGRDISDSANSSPRKLARGSRPPRAADSSGSSRPRSGARTGTTPCRPSSARTRPSRPTSSRTTPSRSAASGCTWSSSRPPRPWAPSSCGSTAGSASRRGSASTSSRRSTVSSIWVSSPTVMPMPRRRRRISLSLRPTACCASVSLVCSLGVPCRSMRSRSSRKIFTCISLAWLLSSGVTRPLSGHGRSRWQYLERFFVSFGYSWLVCR